MAIVSYVARLSYCLDGICVTFPDVPDAHTYGYTREEAVEMAKGALECWFSDGTPLPDPTPLNEIEQNPSRSLTDVLVNHEKEYEFVEIVANIE